MRAVLLTVALVACTSSSTLNPQPAPPENDREISEPSPTIEDRDRQTTAINTTDLALSIAAMTTELDRASVLFTITNAGPNPADQSRIEFTIPQGAALASIDVACGTATAERLCYSNETVASGKTRVITAVFVRDGGASTDAVQLTARTANGDFPDPAPANNAASVSWSWTPP